MKSRQASSARGRWSEVLLGGLAGLGVPVLLLGVARGPGRSSSPATVGVVAGLLGALVGGGLARRTRGAPTLTEVGDGAGGGAAAPQQEEAAVEADPRLEGDLEPRRGPTGRERHWQGWEASTRAL